MNVKVMSFLVVVFGGMFAVGAAVAPTRVATADEWTPIAPVPVDHDYMIDMLHTVPTKSCQMQLVEYLYRESDLLADAYADHLEDRFWRHDRLRKFASELADATGPDDWRRASLLVWIAHRETRLARNPRLLGTEDNGRAAGPWQVWGNRYGSPFRALTAYKMLVAEPSAWSLPKGSEPWVGYPEAASFIADHPFHCTTP